MTYRTPHLKLPILSFVSVACPGPRSGMVKNTKQSQTGNSNHEKTKQTDQLCLVIPNPFMGEGPVDKFSSNRKLQNKPNFPPFQSKIEGRPKNKPKIGRHLQATLVGAFYKTNPNFLSGLAHPELVEGVPSVARKTKRTQTDWSLASHPEWNEGSQCAKQSQISLYYNPATSCFFCSIFLYTACNLFQ